MNIIESILERAKLRKGLVVLPESYDPRVLEAAGIILSKDIARVILLGEPVNVKKRAADLGIELSKASIIDPAQDPEIAGYTDFLYEKRKSKGLTRDQAGVLVRNELYFGALLVRFGRADGMVAGAANTTGDVLRAALQVVGVSPGLKTVSSCFIMVLPEAQDISETLLFADCAVVPAPDAEQLADIATSTALTRRAILGDEPRVALLSFSTKGSAEHELASKVQDACAILKSRAVDFAYDGELQLDAAIVPKIAASKAPGSPVAGTANTLIFPDLQAGNIGYKLVQRLAKAEAVGPIIQGLAAPICDLSRGCSRDDVVNTCALVLLMSK